MDCEFLLSVDDDGEGGVAEDLALQVVGCGEELCGGGAEKGVGVAVAVAGCVVSAGDELRAGAGECGDALMELRCGLRRREEVARGAR